MRITEHNLDSARDECRAADQAAELRPGCDTWGITYQGGQRGQMTRWPDGRGAVEFGGDSLWGEWGRRIDDGRLTLSIDGGGEYDETGTVVVEAD